MSVEPELREPGDRLMWRERKEKEGILTSRFLAHAARSKIGTPEAHAYFKKTMSSSLDMLNYQPSMTQSTAGDQQALG